MEILQPSDLLLSNIKNNIPDFVKFTIEQNDIIINLYNRKDMIVKTKAGSGKTLAFIVGILNMLDKLSGKKIVVLEPDVGHLTNTYNTFSKLSNCLDVQILKCYPGVKSIDFINKLKESNGLTQIIISTPTKFSDCVSACPELFINISNLILDESEDLFGYFIDQLKVIFTSIGPDVNISSFSPILNPVFQNALDNLMVNPVIIKY